jgi:hypothetical protein
MSDDHLIAVATVLDLSSRYCQAFDARDEAALTALFTEDGVWDAGGGRVTGDEVGVLARAAWSSFSSTHHWTTNVTVTEGDGQDGLTARVDVLAMVVPVEGPPTLLAAAYRDRLVPDAGGWKYRERLGAVTGSWPIAA